MIPRIFVYCDASIQLSLEQVQSFLEAMIPGLEVVKNVGGVVFEVTLISGGSTEEAIKAVDDCDDQSKYLDLTEAQFDEMTRLGLGGGAVVGKKRGRTLLRASLENDNEVRPVVVTTAQKEKKVAEAAASKEGANKATPQLSEAAAQTGAVLTAGITSPTTMTFVQCPLDASHSIPLDMLVEHLTVAHRDDGLLSVGEEATSFVTSDPTVLGRVKKPSLLKRAMYGQAGAAPPTPTTPTITVATTIATDTAATGEKNTAGGSNGGHFQAQPQMATGGQTMLGHQQQPPPTQQVRSSDRFQPPVGVAELHLGYQEGQDPPLQNTVREFFAPFCPAVVVRHIRSKFCFFVGFTSPEEAQKAYRSVDRVLSMGANCQMKVGWARAKVQPPPGADDQATHQSHHQNQNQYQQQTSPSFEAPSHLQQQQQQQQQQRPSNSPVLQYDVSPGNIQVGAGVSVGGGTSTHSSLGASSFLHQDLNSGAQQNQSQHLGQLGSNVLVGTPAQLNALPISPEQQLQQLQQQMLMQQQLAMLPQQGGGGASGGLSQLQAQQQLSYQQQQQPQQQQQIQQQTHIGGSALNPLQQSFQNQNQLGNIGADQQISNLVQSSSLHQSSLSASLPSPNTSQNQSSNSVLAFSNLPSNPPTSEQAIYLRLQPFVPLSISLVGPCAFCEFSSAEEAADAQNFVSTKTLGGMPVQVRLL